jgi:hypothetical protein
MGDGLRGGGERRDMAQERGAGAVEEWEEERKIGREGERKEGRTVRRHDTTNNIPHISIRIILSGQCERGGTMVVEENRNTSVSFRVCLCILNTEHAYHVSAQAFNVTHLSGRDANVEHT